MSQRLKTNEMHLLCDPKRKMKIFVLQIAMKNERTVTIVAISDAIVQFLCHNVILGAFAKAWKIDRYSEKRYTYELLLR